MEKRPEYPNQHELVVTLRFKVGSNSTSNPTEFYCYDPADDHIMLANGSNQGEVAHEIHQYFAKRHGNVTTELFNREGRKVGSAQDIDRDY